MIILFLSHFAEIENPAPWLIAAVVEGITLDVFILAMIFNGLAG